ncbi:ATP-dependent nuclease [Ochrobactrum sp. BTU1]|uniref:ATP-dependent nuclease n=1 Tax=Ochrobactrum sp. BTU1 TaxID=2840456 RepID=UPI001C058CBD|nr:AAA family ATPase [Ochrobactrum sp. BTU1]
MIEQAVQFQLPQPWADQVFRRERIGTINFLVGPNGSGKSRFARALRDALPNTRLLSTDRLDIGAGFRNIFGDYLAAGFQKSNFQQFKLHSEVDGWGGDAFIILEERPDIRVRVEATLSSLFNRQITMEWDSGNLLPKVSNRGAAPYRLDRDECHGIRELLVLLTQLYNDRHSYLIIDEPELNLHPQYQAFFLHEVRKVAGAPAPGSSRKGVFLVTHSPFIIDVRSIDDLKSTISFASDHSIPRSPELDDPRFSTLVSRLNVHHKQLFFSDNPIFVEGILDSQMIEAIQERRGFSIASAGSCLIDVGGCEEVNKYLIFCRSLGKKAFFFYDLDSLFLGNLRQCIRDDGTMVEFLAQLGLGQDFSRLCGELDRLLTNAIATISAAQANSDRIRALQDYIDGLRVDGQLVNKNLAKARVAVATELAWGRDEIEPILTRPVTLDIKGRLDRILGLLHEVNVFVLPGGALEHYLPSYRGPRYKLEESAKRNAVDGEIVELATGNHDGVLSERYGELHANICKLPGKPSVDVDTVLKAYLADYIHELQGVIITPPERTTEEINAHFARSGVGLGKLFQISALERLEDRRFRADITIMGDVNRIIQVSDQTNAGMRQFEMPRAAE